MKDLPNLPGDIIGRWFVDSEEDDSPGLLVFTESGHAIQFPSVHRRNPIAVVRSFYEVEAVDTLRFAPEPPLQGFCRQVIKSTSGVSILGESKVFTLRPTESFVFPAWLERDVEASLKKLEAYERPKSKPANKP